MTLSDKSIDVAFEAYLNCSTVRRPSDKMRRAIEAYFTAEKAQSRDWQAIEELLPRIEDTMRYAMELADDNNFHATGMVFRERLAKLRAAIETLKSHGWTAAKDGA